MQITEELFEKVFPNANAAFSLVNRPEFDNVLISGLRRSGQEVTLREEYNSLYNKVANYYNQTLKPILLDCEYSIPLFNTFYNAISTYGIRVGPVYFNPGSIVRFNYGHYDKRANSLNLFNIISRVILDLGPNEIRTITRPNGNQLKFISDQNFAYFNEIERFPLDQLESQERRISTPDQFSQEFFKYSSFDSLIESIHILFKSFSIKDYDKLLEINGLVKTEDNYIEMLEGLFLLDTYNSLIERIWSLALEASASPKHPFLDVVENLSSGGIWLSESAINSLKELTAQKITITLSAGNKTIASLNDSTDIKKLLERLGFNRQNILGKFCQKFDDRKILNSYLYDIILESNRALLPAMLDQLLEKVNLEKKKYKNILKVSDEMLDKIFFEIFDDIEDDRKTGYNSRTLKYMSDYNARHLQNNFLLFSHNLKEIDYNYYHPEREDFSYLIISLIPIDECFAVIQNALNNAEYDLNLDLLDILINECEIFGLKQKYNEKVNQIYLNSNIFSKAQRAIESTLSSNMSSGAGQHLFYLNNRDDEDFVINFQNVEESLSRIESSNDLKYYSQVGMRTLRPEEISADGTSTTNKNAFTIEERLNVLRAGSRLNLIGDRTYNQFVDSLDRLIENGVSEHYDDDLVANFNDKNHVIKALASLTLSSFKAEGQNISKPDQKNIEIKYLKEDSVGETKTNLTTRSFSELALIVNSIPNFGGVISYNKSGLYNSIMQAAMLYASPYGPNFHFASVEAMALFWIFTLSKFDTNSSIKDISETIDNFIQNLPIILEVVSNNRTFETAITEGIFGDGQSHRRPTSIITEFVKITKYSKIETLKNISSILSFYHNNSSYGHNIIIESKHFPKLYLKSYQTLMNIYFTILRLMSKGLVERYGYREGNIYKTPKELKDGILEFKKNLLEDPEFGPEKTEKLFPESKMELLSILDIDSAEPTAADFDRFADKFRTVSSEKYSNILPVVDNLFSMIKQMKDIRDYIGYAKPKDEKVLNNNYAFLTGNNKIRFRTFEDLDPRHFSIGAETDCCQRVGGVGAAAAVDSFINPLAGVMIMEVYHKSDWFLAAQSYFHYVPELEYIILDNIEAKTGNFTSQSIKQITGVTFSEAYAMLAKILLREGYKGVLCGKSFTYVIDEGDFGRAKLEDDPRHFEVEEENVDERYTDFDEDDSFDLTKPNFEVPDINMISFAAARRNHIMIKFANMMLRSAVKDKNLIKLGKVLSDFDMIDESNAALLLGNIRR